MRNAIAEFVEQLKKRLKDNQNNYNQHYSMWGSTDTEFDSKDEFDFDALLKEIDTFSEEFEGNTKTPNVEVRG